jgi:hypothetical protein
MRMTIKTTKIGIRITIGIRQTIGTRIATGRRTRITKIRITEGTKIEIIITI